MKQEFAELWEIARYYIWSQTREECSKKITIAYNEAMLFCIWITKLGHTNDSLYANCSFDVRILTQKNYFQLVDISSFLDCQKELIDYACKIELDGSQTFTNCLENNLSHKLSPYSKDFFKKYGNELKYYNAFSFNSMSGDTCATWEEIYLLDEEGQ